MIPHRASNNLYIGTLTLRERSPQAVCRDVRVAFRLRVRLALTAIRDHSPVDVIVGASAAGRFTGTTAARKLGNYCTYYVKYQSGITFAPALWFSAVASLFFRCQR